MASNGMDPPPAVGSSTSGSTSPNVALKYVVEEFADQASLGEFLISLLIAKSTILRDSHTLLHGLPFNLLPCPD